MKFFLKNLFLFCAFFFYIIFSNNSNALFTPKDVEELKKQYNYLKSIKTVLTEEEKSIIKRYEDHLEFEKEAEESYQEKLEKFEKNPELKEKYASKWQTWYEAIENIRKKEPFIDKLMKDNPNMTFNEAFQLFKKEKWINENKKENIQERSYCWYYRNYCAITPRKKAVKYALDWTSNEKRVRNPKYENYGDNDCTNFISQILEAWTRKYIYNYLNLKFYKKNYE